jgi:ABC-2 type transport system permease protein
MPDWLKVVATINPLSYVVEILRGLLITGNLSNILLDLSILFGMIVLAIIIATKLYPRLA